jgi:tetratricopeptide (TPR) repeat protein
MEDRREFKRYSGRSACEIRIDNSLYKGFVVDYSDGLGVIIENAPLFKKGTVAEIRILNMAAEIKGQLTWVKKMGSDIRAGFRRIGNLKGNLKDFKLPDLLIGIQRGTRTGVLKIVSESIVRQVYIKKGDMIFADSSFEDDRLGELLLREGRITMKQYNLASSRMLETGERLGKILVDMSCLTPHGLYQAVQHQVNEIILSLFSIEEGAFEFREEPLPENTLITLIISAANIIYLGMKRIKSLIYVKQMSPFPESVLDISQDPMNIFQSVSLDNEDIKIMSSINGSRTFKEILELSTLSDFETLKTISAFLRTGIITIKKQDDMPSPVSAGDVLGNQIDETPADFLAKVEELHAKCESAEYYDFLNIGREAASEEIQKAYYEFSKQLHPDRHFSFPEHDIKGKLIEIYAYATEANTILSDPEKREIYDRGISPEARNISKIEETGPASNENNETVTAGPSERTCDSSLESGISDIQDESEQEPGEDSETHYELGSSYMEMGLMEDAIKEFRIASDDPSNKIRCCKVIAECYMDRGDCRNAKKELEKLMSTLSADQEEYHDVKYALAYVYEKSREYDHALELYSEIYSEDAGFRDVARKVGTIRSII